MELCRNGLTRVIKHGGHLHSGFHSFELVRRTFNGDPYIIQPETSGLSRHAKETQNITAALFFPCPDRKRVFFPVFGQSNIFSSEIDRLLRCTEIGLHIESVFAFRME